MLKLTIFSIFLCFGSCFVKPMEPDYKSRPETPQPASSVSENEPDVTPASKEYNEVFFKEVAAKLSKKASSFGLKPLVSSSLAKDSAEVRLYVFPVSTGPIYKAWTVEESVFILKRNGANWSAEAIRLVNKPGKIEKLSEQFAVPKSGWDVLWQKLETLDIFNAIADEKDGFETVAWLYVIETKAAGKYHYGYFHAPKKQGSSKEEQNFANIFALVADEFNASDFKTN